MGGTGALPGGRSPADQLDADDLLLPAVKVDVREQAADADYGVSVADLRGWGGGTDACRRAPVVLWTGWEDRWGTDAYANVGADGVIHQPGFLLEAAEWLIERGVLGERGALGTDTFEATRHRQRLRRLGARCTTGAASAWRTWPTWRACPQGRPC